MSKHQRGSSNKEEQDRDWLAQKEIEAKLAYQQHYIDAQRKAFEALFQKWQMEEKEDKQRSLGNFIYNRWPWKK
jgi:hypothetical protein